MLKLDNLSLTFKDLCSCNHAKVEHLGGFGECAMSLSRAKKGCRCDRYEEKRFESTQTKNLITIADMV